ncbi:MAG: ribonuclease P protein component [Bacillota bacterium]
MGRRKEFERVFREGRRGSTRLVTVWAVPGDGAGVRVGFAIGRRVGRAVVRNRIRRRLRAALAEELAGVPAGTDLVIAAREVCLDAEFGTLREALRAALKKAGAWIDSA